MITIVTAFARSGTSLTMQMLQAAGIPLMWNREPNCTVINPRGHYELDRYRWDADYAKLILPQCEGKAVKIFPANLEWLTRDHVYQFIHLTRDAVNIRDSQVVMLQKENRMKEIYDPVLHLKRIRERQQEMLDWLYTRRHVIIEYENLFTGRAQLQLADFLGLGAREVFAMNACVDPALHHFHPSGK